MDTNKNRMKKDIVTKDDGRYLIYYHFHDKVSKEGECSKDSKDSRGSNGSKGIDRSEKK